MKICCRKLKRLFQCALLLQSQNRLVIADESGSADQWVCRFRMKAFAFCRKMCTICFLCSCILIHHEEVRRANFFLQFAHTVLSATCARICLNNLPTMHTMRWPVTISCYRRFIILIKWPLLSSQIKYIFIYFFLFRFVLHALAGPPIE